jgi:nitric oxide reductase large subunit
MTQCLSNHLTTFAGGWLVLPAPVNWNYVFANADFTKNITIYLTLILLLIVYIAFMIYARYKDKKDVEKVGEIKDRHVVITLRLLLARRYALAGQSPQRQILLSDYCLHRLTERCGYRFQSRSCSNSVRSARQF